MLSSYKCNIDTDIDG